jgi:hypothetical protein
MVGGQVCLGQEQCGTGLTKHSGIDGLVIVGGKGVGDQDGGGVADGKFCQGTGPRPTNHQVGPL